MHSENIRVIDNKFQTLVGKTVEYLYDPNSEAEAMRIGCELLQQDKRVAFILTSCNMARALDELDCVAYMSTVEAGIFFEKTDHFDAVIGITNIVTPVNVKAFVQMIFQIRDCKRRILSLYYQRNSSELFRPPGYKNIHAELESAWPNDLPTAIRGYRKWNKNIVSYKLDQSPAIILYLKVEH
ncbi:hypothetical protein C1645_840623 [Glomus cerebriforme]|uniref:Uncharacterized protein n=1 Tax=Glomus cerebriforme TaxID=658196 RepID=A0A397S416_9GLOM|nr:hypothetical protein C1645_840623 [Glomus cerebriforme]